MAFNRQTFKTRTLTAIVFVAVMLAGLLIDHWSFLVLFSIIHFGCWWEFLKLTEKIYNTSFHVYTKMGLMVMGYGIVLFFCNFNYEIANYALRTNLSWPVSLAGFVVLIIGIFQQRIIALRSFAAAFAGIAYISVSIGMLIGLYGIESGIPMIYKENNFYLFYFPLFTIGCLWINDTMAYIVGSLIGKTLLSKISPKKTWEGTLGGIVLSVAIMGSLHLFIDEKYSFHQNYIWWIMLALVIVVAGTLGDLLESKLKRMANVKDSGSLMPGHGGFLDRFDSLLLAAPFVWLYFVVFMK